MTNETAYITTHDHISPTPDLMTEAELRAYLAERAAEDPDPDRGWVRAAETLEVRERCLCADLGGDEPEPIAEEVRTTTVAEALTDATRADIAATVEELEGLPALRCPVTIGSTDPDWPQLIVVDPYRRQPINAGRALEEARAYLEVAE